MQPTLTFQLDGPTGNLQILKSGLLVAELTIDDQVQLLIQVAHAHTVRQDHIRVNNTPPQPHPGIETLTPRHLKDVRPITRPILDPTA